MVQTKLCKLYEPIEIGPVEIKNRITMAPMNCLYSDRDGYVSEQQLAYYAARAKGGMGLIITEATMGSALGAKFPFVNNLCLWNRSHMAGLSELTETVHYFAAKIFVQLSIGFGNKSHTTLDGEQPYDPSPIHYETPLENLPKGMKRNVTLIHHIMKGEVPREMTVEEMKSLLEAYANSARMAVACGFNGIEIHAPVATFCTSFCLPSSTRGRTNAAGAWRTG